MRRTDKGAQKKRTGHIFCARTPLRRPYASAARALLHLVFSVVLAAASSSPNIKRSLRFRGRGHPSVRKGHKEQLKCTATRLLSTFLPFSLQSAVSLGSCKLRTSAPPPKGYLRPRSCPPRPRPPAPTNLVITGNGDSRRKPKRDRRPGWKGLFEVPPMLRK